MRLILASMLFSVVCDNIMGVIRTSSISSSTRQSVTGVIDQRVQHRVVDADDTRGGLVRTLVLNEMGGLFVERYATRVLALTIQLVHEHLLVTGLAIRSVRRDAQCGYGLAVLRTDGCRCWQR